MTWTVTSGARQRGHGDARIARRRWAHRVEQVRDRARAAIEGQVRLGGRRVGVPAGDGDARADELVDQLEGARQLGRQRHLAHRAGVEQPPQQREVGRAAALGVVAPSRCGDRNGPSRCAPMHPRAAALARHRAQRRGEVDLGRGDEGRLEGGDAGGQQRFAGAR
jgi:hypothetical protein